MMLRRGIFPFAGGGGGTRVAARMASTTGADGVAKGWVDEADTVVVGGGVIGCSVAYHLAKGEQSRGRRPSVVLLEKSDLTAGSTWHAAGLTTTFHPLVNLKRLHWRSLNFFREVEKESGQQVGLHQPGSLRLATNGTRMDEFLYQRSRQSWNSAPMRIWSQEDIRKRIPIMDIEGGGILGGLFTPGDGHVDPYSLTQAIASAARKRGAKIFQKAEVTDVNQLSDGRWEIGTQAGKVTAGRVVNASGFWGKELSSKFGVEVPLVPIHHQYLVTKTVPEESDT